jgi:hypothetical protein
VKEPSNPASIIQTPSSGLKMHVIIIKLHTGIPSGPKPSLTAQHIVCHMLKAPTSNILQLHNVLHNICFDTVQRTYIEPMGLKKPSSRC